MKIYDYTHQRWVREFDGQWAYWHPQKGVYWTHYKLYTSSGLLADTKTHMHMEFNYREVETPNTVICAVYRMKTCSYRLQKSCDCFSPWRQESSLQRLAKAL